MTSVNQAFPRSSPLLDSNGRITQVWITFFLALWNRTGASGGATVSNLELVNNNGITGSVTDTSTDTTLTLGLGNITPASVNASGSVTGSNLSGTNTGNVSLAGSPYLSLSGQTITANPVNVGTAQITGILSAGSFPALTGSVTTVAGSTVATTTGLSVTIVTASLTIAGTQGSMTFTNGLLTAQTQAT